METSTAEDGAKMAPKNAFDLMMGRDKSILRYKGFRGLGSDIYSLYAVLAELLEDVGREVSDDVAGIDYEEFHERYFHLAIGRVSEAEFQEFWEEGDWETWLCYDGGEGSDGYSSTLGPGATLSDIQDKPKVLKSFVQQRGLEDPFSHRMMHAYYYTRLLKQADEDYTFRFLDLPIELRLQVYRELLLFSDVAGEYEEKSCHPAILQTCHEVHAEAKSVLYDENVIECSFSLCCDEESHGFRVRRARVHNNIVRGACPHAPFARVPAGIDDYPDFLSRISQLKIEVRYNKDSFKNPAGDECCSPLGHYLYTLASFLMDNHRLKSLQICADLGDVEEWVYGLTLWPLRRLRNVKNVTLQDVPSKYGTKIISDLTSIEPAFNTMRHWKLLEDEAMAQLELLDGVMPTCPCEECEKPCQVEEILAQLRVIESEKFDCCLCSRHEEFLMARLAQLQTLLQNLSLEPLERLFQDVKAKRAAYAKYDKVSDDGRLAEAAKVWKGKMTEHEKNKEDHDWSDDEEDNTVPAANMDDEPDTDSFHGFSSAEPSSSNAAKSSL